MAPRQAKHYKRRRQQPSTLQIKRNVSRPQGIRKEVQSLCRKRDRSYEQGTIPTSRSPLPASCPPIKTQNPLKFQVNDQQRKRACDTGEPCGHHVKRLDKRQRTLNSAGEDAVNGTTEPTNADLPLVAQTVDPDHKRQYPEPKHFPDNSNPPSKRPRTDIKFTEYWALHEYEWPKEPLGPDPMEYFIARSKTPSLRRTKSNGSLNTASETSSREAKSRPYTDKNYDTYLETNGCFMYDHDDGIDGDSRSVCHQILSANPEVPKETVFQEGVFESRVEGCKGKMRLELFTLLRVQLISVGSHSRIWLSVWMKVGRARFLLMNLNNYHELYSLYKLRSLRDPHNFDYHGRSRIMLWVSPGRLFGDTSFFMSTAFMNFPFMTAEVKCGKAALYIADRQNAHSMTLSVRGVVKLFRLVKREKELHQQILAFSISHDHRMARTYGHYPVTDRKKTTYYRLSIHEFSSAAPDGREKWTPYKFVMGVYNDWVPFHFRCLCSAIDELPEVNFEVSQQSEPSFSEPTGLSQEIEGVHVQDSSFTSILGEETRPTPHLTGCSLACSSSNAGK
ncbi:hypothetical protein GX48_01486 [Paracoccidioides brasiliensis]|nr:hypothetical protein GX48_01486 [Paracoccidioides brasiliensis]